MNAAAQHSWWLTYSNFQKSREQTWQSVIAKNLNDQIQPTIQILKDHGIQTAISQLNSVPLSPIEKTIKNIYIDAGTVFGGKAYQIVKRQAEPKKQMAFAGDNYEEKRLMPIGFNDQLVQDIVNYYNLFLLSKAVIPISETTKQFILDQLTEAQQQGLSIQDTVNSLENTDITRNRARLIARTETAKASQFGAMWGARKTNYVTDKVWISAIDMRTRRLPENEYSHLAMNGVKVGMNEPFMVPRREGGYERMDHPADPNGSAADIVNCRCSVGFSVKRDSSGRPLRIA